MRQPKRTRAAFGLEIEYVVEDEPLGTGGAIRNVVGRLRGRTAPTLRDDILGLIRAGTSS